MIERSTCACPLCRLERELMVRFAIDSSNGPRPRVFASSPGLAAFSSISALLAHLKRCGQEPAGLESADRIFRELLQLPRTDSTSTVDEIFIVAFLPVVHLIMRRILERFPALSQDDVAHQVLLFLLQFLRSAELRPRESYFAFAISRKLKRSSFEWAKRQCRLQPLNGHGKSAEVPAESSFESFERFAFLRHFLNSCVSKRWIDEDDLDLLIQFKVDGFSGEDLAAAEGVSSNAMRQRVKRLVAKLRSLAREPNGSSIESEVLDLMDSSSVSRRSRLL